MIEVEKAIWALNEIGDKEAGEALDKASLPIMINYRGGYKKDDDILRNIQVANRISRDGWWLDCGRSILRKRTRNAPEVVGEVAFWVTRTREGLDDLLRPFLQAENVIGVSYFQILLSSKNQDTLTELYPGLPLCRPFFSSENTAMRAVHLAPFIPDQWNAILDACGDNLEEFSRLLLSDVSQLVPALDEALLQLNFIGKNKDIILPIHLGSSV